MVENRWPPHESHNFRLYGDGLIVRLLTFISLLTSKFSTVITQLIEGYNPLTYPHVKHTLSERSSRLFTSNSNLQPVRKWRT